MIKNYNQLVRWCESKYFDTKAQEKGIGPDEIMNMIDVTLKSGQAPGITPDTYEIAINRVSDITDAIASIGVQRKGGYKALDIPASIVTNMIWQNIKQTLRKLFVEDHTIKEVYDFLREQCFESLLPDFGDLAVVDQFSFVATKAGEIKWAEVEHYKFMINNAMKIVSSERKQKIEARKEKEKVIAEDKKLQDLRKKKAAERKARMAKKEDAAV